MDHISWLTLSVKGFSPGNFSGATGERMVRCLWLCGVYVWGNNSSRVHHTCMPSTKRAPKHSLIRKTSQVLLTAVPSVLENWMLVTIGDVLLKFSFLCQTPVDSASLDMGWVPGNSILHKHLCYCELSGGQSNQKTNNKQKIPWLYGFVASSSVGKAWKSFSFQPTLAAKGLRSSPPSVCIKPLSRV